MSPALNTYGENFRRRHPVRVWRARRRYRREMRRQVRKYGVPTIFRPGDGGPPVIIWNKKDKP